MDDIDRAIVDRLRSDSRSTNAAIGSLLGLSEGAVRHRIARLVADGVVLRFTVVTRPLGPEGLVLLRCRPGATPKVVEQLRDQVADLFETSGEYDLAVTVEAPTMEGFNERLDRLRSIPGVESTTTLVRLTRFVGPSAAAHRAVSRRSPVRRQDGRARARSRSRAA